MRSSKIAVAVAVACGVAVSLLTASLDDLVAHPARHGWTWDVLATCDEGYCELPDKDQRLVRRALAGEPTIDAWAFVTYGTFQIDDHVIPLVGIGPMAGPFEPFTITRGRAPSRPDEVALGASTLRRLGRNIGDRLTIDASRTELRVVGEAVFPGIGRLDATHASLGAGAALTGEGAAAVLGGEFNPDGLLVDLRAGGRERLETLFPGFVLIDARAPGSLLAWSSLRALTSIAAVGLTLLALASVVHARLLASRLQTRDLAVLEALGMQRRQLRRSLQWQSVMLLATGVLAGAPIGAFIGLRAWALLADKLTVASPPRVLSPQLALTGTSLALITLALTLTARRRWTSPSTTLRAE